MDNFFITQWYDWSLPSVSRPVQAVNRILARLGFWVSLQPPRVTGCMTNVEKRINIYHLLSQVLAYRVPGDIVELGCNRGQASTLPQRIIEEYDPSRRLHVYDSFEGLPALDEKDAGSPYAAGTLEATRDALLANFESQGLRPPEIHQGWFNETLPNGLPDPIAFAYLDGDLYDSIKVSLEHVYPKLSRGAICLIDDYADPVAHPESWNLLPGVKAACDEFLADKPEKVSCLYAAEMSHGYFRKA